MFHFPTSPPHRLCIHLQVTPHNWCWVSPFGHPRINALLATPRGLTQPHTSFIGPACQGIHHTPVTQNNNYGRYKNCRQLNKQKLHKKNKMLASTIQFSHNTHPTKTNHHNRRSTNNGMPQQGTHNVAPDTQQHANTPKTFVAAQTYLASWPSVHTPTTTPHTHISMKTMVGCVSTRTFTNISVAAPHSGTQPPHPQLWAINKSSLERR